MKIGLSSFFFALLCLYLHAQTPEHFGYGTNIQELFGIDAGDVYDITEDWNGFVWVATSNGLFRLDGTMVKQFTHSGMDTTLKHDAVYDVHVDTQRRVLWLGTAMGLTKFDPVTEKSQHYQADYTNPNSLADNIVRYVYTDKDAKVWVACYNHGLSLYREETDDFENFYYELKGIDEIQEKLPTVNQSRINSFKYIAQDKIRDEIIWLGTPRGLVSFNQQTKEFEWQYLRNPEDQTEYRIKSITAIYPLDHRLILGTPAKTYIYDPQSSTLTFISPIGKSGEELEFAFYIYQSAPNLIHLTFKEGMAIYNLQTEQMETVLEDDPIEKKYYGTQLIDSKGRIWVNSSKTIMMYDPLKQVANTYLLNELKGSTSRVFRKINDTQLGLLTSQSRNYHIFDIPSRKWRSFQMNGSDMDWEALKWQDVVRLSRFKWLMIAENQIYELNTQNNSLSLIELDLPHQAPIFLKGLLDSRGDLWLATRRVGVFKVDLATKKLTHYIDELNSQFSSSLYTWIMNLHEDVSGNIWIRLGRSYAIYFPEKDSFKVFSHYQNPGKTFRYIRNFVDGPHGNVWISSEYDGFGVTDKDALDKGVIQKITTRDHIMSDRLQQIDYNKDQLLWILSEKGFSTYHSQKGDIQNYTWDRGIPKTSQFITLEDGNIACMLDTAGIAILTPDLLRQEGNNPIPYITGVKAKDKMIFQAGNRVDIRELNLRSEREYLAFEFSALGYLNPKEFRYKLQAEDEHEGQWIETYDHRSTSYSNLSPGDYTFYLQSRFEGGPWSAPRMVNIHIAPYWWETGWFQTLALLFLTGIGYFAYRWRLEDVRQQERFKSDYQRRLDELEMKVLRSQMNPHFMFNSLNAIQLYIIRNNPKQAISYLDKFARLMRLFLQNSRHKTVVLKEELEALKLYMELESLRFKVHFDYQIKIAPSINVHEVEIPPMLLQPFIENAIWHGIQHKEDSGQILIHIKEEDNQIVCTIQDDGVGRTYTQALHDQRGRKHKSMGMQITQNRLDMLNQLQDKEATIEIEDLFDGERAAGTKVIIRLPL